MSILERRAQLNKQNPTPAQGHGADLWWQNTRANQRYCELVKTGLRWGLSHRDFNSDQEHSDQVIKKSSSSDGEARWGATRRENKEVLCLV